MYPEPRIPVVLIGRLSGKANPPINQSARTYVPLLLLPLQLVGGQVVEVGRQLEASGVGALPEGLRLPVQLGADGFPTLQPVPPLSHQLQGIGALLGQHQELLVLLW